MSSPHAVMLDRIDAELTRCLAAAESHFCRTFTRPQVTYDLRGTTAGTARVQRNMVRLNLTLLLANQNEMIEQTLPHEVAHLIDYTMYPGNFAPSYGRKRTLHGPTWARIMRVFGKKPERCHKMDTTLAAVRVTRRHEYRCACGAAIVVGPKRHKLLQMGSTFRHIRCGNPIDTSRYVGLSKQTQEILAARSAARGGK